MKSFLKRIPFYYRYFGEKKDKDIKNVIAADAKEELGFKSASSITNDLSSIIENPGRKKYGYNTIFIYNQLQNLMGLDTVCYFYILGPQYEFLKNKELQNRNFYITENSENHIDMLIITENKGVSKILEEHPEVKIIINFTNEKINAPKIFISNFNITELLTEAFFVANNQIDSL